MTQPNPTDDLEAVVYRACSDYHAAFYGPVATRPARRDQAVKDGVEAILDLRPAGVGEAEQFERWIETLRTDVIQDEYGYEDGEFSVDPDHWHPLWKEGLTPSAAFARALTAHRAATPAHPDAALMERVRTVLEPFAKAGDLFDAHDYVNRDACIYRPAAGDDYSLDSGHLLEARALLSDLKAEAGR